MNIGIDVHKGKAYIAYSLEEGGIECLCDDNGNDKYIIMDGNEGVFFDRLLRALENKFPQEKFKLFFGYDKKITEISKYYEAAQNAGFEISGSCDRAVLAAMAYSSKIGDASVVIVVFVEEDDTKLFELKRKKSGYSLSQFVFVCDSYEETYITNNLFDDSDKLSKVISFITSVPNRKAVIVGEKSGELLRRFDKNNMVVQTDYDKRLLAVAYGAAICNHNLSVPTAMRFATRLVAELTVAGKKDILVLIDKGQDVEANVQYKTEHEFETRNPSVSICILDDGVKMEEFVIRWNEAGSIEKTRKHAMEFVVSFVDGKACVSVYEYALGKGKGGFVFGGLKKSKELKKEIEILF